jgi:hypothetical protein
MTMMTMLRGYFYFNSLSIIGPPGHTWRSRSCPGLGSGSWSRRARGGPRAAPGWAAGAGATGHVAAPELPRAGQRELEPQGMSRPRSCPDWAAGAGVAGHVAAPELPRLGSRSWSHRARGGPGAAPAGQRELEPQDTWQRRSPPQ